MNFINNPEEQSRDEIFEMGKEFAFEGLTEDDFKAKDEDELKRFRRGFEVGMSMQPEASIPTEEFKKMGR